MKYIILLLLLIPLIGKTQTTIISVTIQARDCEYIASFTGTEEQFQDLDSAMKSKFRPAFSAPSGTTNVTLGGATNGTWYQIMYRLRRDFFACQGNNNEFTRIDVVLRALNNVWLTAALDADALDWENNGHTPIRTNGRRRLKHE